MKHKTSELEAALLDAAVAKAEGLPYPHWIVDEGWFRPSTNWVHGGEIIERERITIVKLQDDEANARMWCAWSGDQFNNYIDTNAGYADGSGPTPLIAAMRAYVASKFGDEVELP